MPALASLDDQRQHEQGAGKLPHRMSRLGLEVEILSFIIGEDSDCWGVDTWFGRATWFGRVHAIGFKLRHRCRLVTDKRR